MKIYFPFLIAIGALTPCMARATSVDWTCQIGGAYSADERSHLETSTQNGALVGRSFIVDFDSGLIFSKTLPSMEHLLATTVISKAYKDRDYLVAYNGPKPAFLYIQASFGQEKKPFTLFEGATGTLFVGTCLWTWMSGRALMPSIKSSNSSSPDGS